RIRVRIVVWLMIVVTLIQIILIILVEKLCWQLPTLFDVGILSTESGRADPKARCPQVSPAPAPAGEMGDCFSGHTHPLAFSFFQESTGLKSRKFPVDCGFPQCVFEDTTACREIHFRTPSRLQGP